MQNISSSFALIRNTDFKKKDPRHNDMSGVEVLLHHSWTRH
jgi:hypothetical protein